MSAANSQRSAWIAVQALPEGLLRAAGSASRVDRRAPATSPPRSLTETSDTPLRQRNCVSVGSQGCGLNVLGRRLRLVARRSGKGSTRRALTAEISCGAQGPSPRPRHAPPVGLIYAGVGNPGSAPRTRALIGQNQSISKEVCADDARADHHSLRRRPNPHRRRLRRCRPSRDLKPMHSFRPCDHVLPLRGRRAMASHPRRRSRIGRTVPPTVPPRLHGLARRTTGSPPYREWSEVSLGRRYSTDLLINPALEAQGGYEL